MSSLAELVDSGVLAENVELAAFTTYKMGGAARFFLEARDEQSLVSVIRAMAPDPGAVFVLGRGSNVVISDSGFPGVVIKPSGEFARWSIDADGVVTAGAAVPLPLLARGTAKIGRGGLEWFVGVPGSVGGAVCMNAGCFGSETADSLVTARLIDLRTGEVTEATAQDLDMSYRHTSVGIHDMVLSARFATSEADPAAAEARIREITRWRRDNQPGGTLNAGSVFKNPAGDSAGRLIDSCGLKGFGIGDVSVSQRHANFFVAGAGARPDDVHRLVAEVRRRVHEATGVELEPEVRFVGVFDEEAR